MQTLDNGVAIETFKWNAGDGEVRWYPPRRSGEGGYMIEFPRTRWDESEGEYNLSIEDLRALGVAITNALAAGR